MYGSYIMRRTQIYLEDRQLSGLRAVARASGRTVSEVIRDAVDDKLAGPRDGVDFDSALDRVTGIWANRADLGATDDLVRRLRTDRRGQE
jgi:hypothetical protein